MDGQQAIERTVSGLGFDLIEVERGPRGLLRVYIDRAPGGNYASGTGEFITVGDCEQVTRQLQYVLEVEGCNYTRLEVSSPGLDRRLNKPADFRRFAGKEIELTLKTPLAGRKNYRGLLEPAQANWRLVYAEGRAEQALDFSIDEVREARLVPVIDFKGRAKAAERHPAPAADMRAGGGQAR